ncbi:MAG: hypothetical protein QOD84_893 [Acidobacteriaceae bacterium]
MDPVLANLRKEVESVCEGMSTDAMARHSEGKWSAAEVLEHLSLTYGGTIKGFQRCLQAGKPLATAATLRSRIGAYVVTSLGYLPEGRTAPENTKPKGKSMEMVRDTIGPLIAEMDELIGNCERLYGSSICLLDHPIIGPLTARQWRRFHWIHGKHHLKQIKRLRETQRS